MNQEHTQSEDILSKGSSGAGAASANSDYFADLAMRQANLCEKLMVSGFDPCNWIQSAAGFLQIYHRFRYADISSFIYAICSDVKRESIFLTNLSAVQDYISEKYEDAPSARKEEFFRILKFCDHANLAYQQSHLVSSSKDDLKKSVSSDIADAVTNATKDVSSQLVGLVSLFTALAFILFGGITSLESIFTFLGDMVNSESRWFAILPPVIVALLWTFCMANILFLFMVFVLRIIDRPLHYGDTVPPSNKRDALETIKQFPILMLIDYILFCLTSSLILVYIVAVTATGNRIISSVMNSMGSTVIAVGVFIWLLMLDKLRVCIFSHVVILGDKRPELLFTKVINFFKKKIPGKKKSNQVGSIHPEDE